MKKNGSIIHNSQKFEYQVDEHGYVWITVKMGKINIGQVRPLSPSSDIEQVLHEMLDAGGY